MTTDLATRPSATTPDRRLPAALWAGLALTAVTIVALIVDQAGPDSLAAHLRATYPADYDADNLAAAKGFLLTYLFIVGGLGVIGWWVSLRAVHSGSRWTTALLWSLFVGGTAIAVTNLLLVEQGYGRLLPTWLGLVGLLPSIAGLAAVLLWHRRRRR